MPTRRTASNLFHDKYTAHYVAYTMTTMRLVLPQRPSSRQPSSTRILSSIVILLIVVQVFVVQLSFDGKRTPFTSATTATDMPCSQATTSSLSASFLQFGSSESVQKPALTSTRSGTRRNHQGVTPDGTFNGYPIYHRRASSSGNSTTMTTTTSQHSSVQCVGQNFRNDSWIHRSCKFRHLCFDTVEQNFVIYQSKEDAQLQQAMRNNPFAESSSDMDADVGVAIGGINTKWTWSRGVPRLRWFPKVVQGALEEDYYELDADVVMVPFHSFFAQNPGKRGLMVLHIDILLQLLSGL